MKCKSIFLIISVCIGIYSQTPNIGKPVIAYTNATLNSFLLNDPTYHSVGRFVYDVSLCPILQDDGSIECLLSTPLYGNDFYRGNLNDNTFLSRHVGTVEQTYYWGPPKIVQVPAPYPLVGTIPEELWYTDLHKNFTGYAVPFEGEIGYIANIYVVSSALWIGFVHIERSNQTLRTPTVINRNYAIGIASSSDKGRTWKYYGDVIRPFYDPAPPTMQNNIGGVPYIVYEVAGEQYFYVYFNESKINEAPGKVGVAREKVSIVLSMINNASIAQPWKKYNVTNPSNPWNTDGLTGEGTDIMYDLSYNSSPTHYYLYNMHTDAACVKVNKTYVMFPGYSKARFGTATPVEMGLVYLQSKDGIKWSIAGYIDSSPATSNECYVYASVFPADNKGSIDGSVVFDRFSIVYPKLPIVSGAIQIDQPEVRKVDIIYPSITPVLNLLLD